MASQTTSLTIVYSAICSRCRSKKTSKLRVTGLCEGNSPVTSEFSAQMASNAEMFPLDDVIMLWWLVTFLSRIGMETNSVYTAHLKNYAHDYDMGSAFRTIGLIWRESDGRRGIPSQKISPHKSMAIDAAIWCFLVVTSMGGGTNSWDDKDFKTP